MAAVVAGLSGGSARPAFVPGGLYAIEFEDRSYHVAKVLVVDEHVIHVRFYKESFATRPTQVDPASLTLGRVGDADGFGISHVLQPENEFRDLYPQLIQVVEVTEEDLEDYRYWQQDHGGVRGSQ